MPTIFSSIYGVYCWRRAYTRRSARKFEERLTAFQPLKRRLYAFGTFVEISRISIFFILFCVLSTEGSIHCLCPFNGSVIVSLTPMPFAPLDIRWRVQRDSGRPGTWYIRGKVNENVCGGWTGKSDNEKTTETSRRRIAVASNAR